MKRRKFIKVTSISGVVCTGLFPLLGCSSSDPDIEEELKQQSLLAFNRFEDVWNFNDFWKRGNTFDAVLYLWMQFNNDGRMIRKL